MIEERGFVDLAAAADATAGLLARALRRGVAERGRASMAVSGGRTPLHVFRALATEEVDWARVTLTLTDERWVAPDHPESNEGMVRRSLMEPHAGLATFVPLYGGEADPEGGRAACDDRLRRVPRPFDAVYLGVGPDGHVASLFPGDEALDQKDPEALCLPVAGSGRRMPRMSLTASTLLDTRQVVLLLSGPEKLEAYRAALQPGSARERPLRRFLHQEDTPVSIFHAPDSQEQEAR